MKIVQVVKVMGFYVFGDFKISYSSSVLGNIYLTDLTDIYFLSGQRFSEFLLFMYNILYTDIIYIIKCITFYF